MFAKINEDANFTSPSLQLYICKLILKTVEVIQVITHKYYTVMLQEKKKWAYVLLKKQSHSGVKENVLLRKGAV